jgi:hypothetical protein
MKNILVLFLFVSTGVFSQIPIEKLLNKELNLELKRIQESSDFEDTLIVIQPFQIENNVLSLTVKKKSYYDNSLYIMRQEVALDNIISIVKDINVIFVTKEDAITVTKTDANGHVSTRSDNLFFLQLSVAKNNESLANAVVKAFKKEGFTIEKSHWFD